MIQKLLHKAGWWRSAMRLKGKKISSVGEEVDYNVFNFYIPYEEATRHKHSLHFTFLKVNADDPQEVLKFCESYGVLGPPLDYSRGWAREWKTEMERILSKIELKVKPRNSEGLHTDLLHRIENYESGVQILKLVGLPSPHSLFVPMTLDRFRSAQDRLRRFINLANQLGVSGGDDLERDRTAILMNLHLSGLRPRIEWEPQIRHWNLAWDSLSLEGILWLMTLLDLMGPGQFLNCAQCHTPFLGTTSKARFCSGRCNNLHKQERFQQRKAQKKKSKKDGRKGKTPTRKSKQED